MSDHQILASSLLEDLLHIPAETTVEEFREKDDTFRAQTESKGKEVVAVLHDEDARGSSGGAAKKQERNAKERLRRMRLHASYLTLGTLLTDHSSSSKVS